MRGGKGELGPLGFLLHRVVGVAGIESVKTMNFQIFIFEILIE